MAEKAIIKSIKDFLNELVRQGVPVEYGVLFGSYVGGRKVDQWSDIDLLVISPRYDRKYGRKDINLLWRIAARTDSRIEPIPVGIKRWQTDNASTILEIARREGVRVSI
jgi:predicted nucleotidyltransferase